MTDGVEALDRESLLKELLLDLSVDMTGVVGTFVASDVNPAGHLQVLHGFPRQRGAGLDCGKVFAHLNDVEGLDLDIFEPNEDLSEVMPETGICNTVDLQLQQFAGDEALQVVPRHAVNAANTRAVKTPMSMHIPCALVPSVMGQNLTPREALTTLVPVMQDLELEPQVGPLLDFLMAVSTATVGKPPATALDSLGTPPDLGGAQVANDWQKKLLFVHLPKLKPNTQAKQDPAVTGIMRALEGMQTLTTEDLADQRAKRDSQKKDKTIAKKWPNQVKRLCWLCDVCDWDELPSCWKNAAALKKGSSTTLALLQDEVNILATKLDCRPPTVTTQHNNAIVGWAFARGLPCQLGTGLFLFTVTPPGAVSSEALAQLEQERESVCDCETVVAGTAITAADACTLRTGNACMPIDWSKAEGMLEACCPLLAGSFQNILSIVQVLQLEGSLIPCPFPSNLPPKPLRMRISNGMKICLESFQLAMLLCLPQSLKRGR